MPLKFDEKGLLVLNTGFYISIEYYIPNYEFISIKFIQGIYNDCIKQFAGFTHIGFRLNTPELNGFMFSGGIWMSTIPIYIKWEVWKEICVSSTRMDD